MTRTYAFLTVCLLAIGVSALAAPKLVMTEDHFDFGYTPQHSHVAHRFMLKSTGDSAVSITRIVPGCACTKLPLEKEVLAPGDSGFIEIQFNSFTYTNLTERTPRFYTNDTAVGSEREHTITFRSNITSRPDSTYPVIIYPYKLDMTPIGGMDRDKIKFTITNVSDKDLTLTMIAEPKEIGVANLPAIIKAKSEATGTFALSKAALAIEFEKSFTFSVSDSANSRFTVPIKRAASPEKAKADAAKDAAADGSSHE